MLGFFSKVVMTAVKFMFNFPPLFGNIMVPKKAKGFIIMHFPSQATPTVAKFSLYESNHLFSHIFLYKNSKWIHTLSRQPPIFFSLMCNNSKKNLPPTYFGMMGYSFWRFLPLFINVPISFRVAVSSKFEK